MNWVLLYLLLYLCATVCFFAYTVGKQTPRVHLLGLGVFFWSLVPLVQTLVKVI